jgi:hypothetical protein
LLGLSQEERELKIRERERAEANRKKEVQLKQMDELKKFMIADIMRRGNTAGDSRGCGIDLKLYEEICFGVTNDKNDV